MIHIKNLLFPNLCHRCHKEEKNFLCQFCLLGIELSDVQKENVAYLFSSGIDFLKKNREDYQKIIFSCSIIRLEKLGWKYGKIQAEPELLFLKKYLQQYTCASSAKTLYLLHREEDPILLEPIKKQGLVLVI